ncbi:hypothetical protein DFJ67_0750 [Asanoa ferruginea]|uniref:Uncharacterized protein n=1 Tax=Asanoa ferruginea TaxID=53367 RepID=A0A3D9ZBL0_9ACTN|nr:hypothetical protein [Asanoa ferruginea]REF94806.1 hypothetical protein DFJ67_0750 [Asanoa ferruginea]GIF45616.1 hypothetical protein Afe04nite_01550 [Asanoa ferruginea]
MLVRFPASLDEHAAAVTAALPSDRSALGSFEVVVDGEPMVVPDRIYADEPPPEVWAALRPIEQTMLHCLYTRHHDGRVRERHLAEIMTRTEPWIAPFVVHLVGEYVVEIVELIQRSLTDLRGYRRFAAANPAFIDLTYQRAVSYWDCYYRWPYPNLKSYPGVVLIGPLRSRRRVRPPIHRSR